MLEGFYSIASGVLMQERTLNVISNNIANVRTPGFKVERVISTTFEEELMRRQERYNTDNNIGKGVPIRITRDVASNYGENLIEETARPFDMALKGDGYFNVRSTAPAVDMGQNAAAPQAGQQFLTRNGNFDVDDEGFLILRGVGRVLGEKGEIQVNSSDITVSDEGVITDAAGKELDKLLITQPAQDVSPERFANGLYTVPDFGTNTAPADYRVFQGSIERSNIDLNREYTQAIEAQRVFNACSSALKIIDQLNSKSVSQIASVG